MSARAGTRAVCHSPDLVLAILVDRNQVSMRELVLCFLSCKAFRELLDGRGFCIGTAWLCASLGNGRSPTEILTRLRSARVSVVYERPVSRVDQVTSFLMRYEDNRERWGWAWAQLLYQEPDGGVLCEGVKKMLWLLKRSFVKELHKSTGYYPGLCTLTGHSGAVLSLAWSPDGKLVASGCSDKSIRIWDVATGKAAMGPLKGHSDWVMSVAWSPCGNFVASGSHDRTVRIWDIQTGSEKCSMKGHSEDNPECTCNHRARQHGWGYESNPECPVTGHSGKASSVAWSPDGKLVASLSKDKSVRIWDVCTGKLVTEPLTGSCASWVHVCPEIRALGEQVRHASETPNRRVCTGNYNVTANQCKVVIYKVLEGRERDVEQETEHVALFRCPDFITCVACRPPYICVGCNRGQVIFLDAPLLCEGAVADDATKACICTCRDSGWM